MKYRMKRHITNTLLWATVITAVMGIIRQYTMTGMIIFAVVSVALLCIDRYVENKENEGK